MRAVRSPWAEAWLATLAAHEARSERSEERGLVQQRVRSPKSATIIVQFRDHAVRASQQRVRLGQ